IQMAQGHFKEALENLMTAKRVGGAPPSPLFSQSLAFGLLANDRFDEAITEAQLAIAQNVGRDAWLALIAAESENGQDAGARRGVACRISSPCRGLTAPGLRSRRTRHSLPMVNCLTACAALGCPRNSGIGDVSFGSKLAVPNSIGKRLRWVVSGQERLRII